MAAEGASCRREVAAEACRTVRRRACVLQHNKQQHGYDEVTHVSLNDSVYGKQQRGYDVTHMRSNYSVYDSLVVII